jgi:hypothetical protein
MRPEYEFDYRGARPNRFAPQLRSKVVAVILEPDVAQVFDSSESVNRLLRSVISAVPERRHRAASRKPRRKAG